MSMVNSSMRLSLKTAIHVYTRNIAKRHSAGIGLALKTLPDMAKSAYGVNQSLYRLGISGIRNNIDVLINVIEHYQLYVPTTIY